MNIRMVKLVVPLLLIVVVLCTPTNSSLLVIKESSRFPSSSPSPSPFPPTPSFSYISHAPILIHSDLDLETLGFPGTGVAEDPYRIEHYNITTSNGSAISITNTTKYIIVSECFLYAEKDAIFLEHIQDGKITISNNFCYTKRENSILISYSNNITVRNNTCTTKGLEGIRIVHSNGCTIIENTCMNNNWDGIFLRASNNTLVKGNRVHHNNKGGIYADDSFAIVIENNICSDNNFGGGINLHESFSSEIFNNLCFNNSQDNIAIFFSSNVSISENTCLDNGVGIVVTESQNCTVANNFFANSGLGLWVLFTSFPVIRNNSFEHCGVEFYGDSAETFPTYTVEDNLINNKPLGFFVNLHKKTIKQSLYGQLILANCSKVVIKNQQISQTTDGLYLIFCSDVTIKNSVFSENAIGVSIVKTSFSLLINNTFSSNWEFGLFLDNSSFNLITYNTFQENTLWGVYINFHCFNNTIHHNSFIDNNKKEYFGFSQAYDLGLYTLWYDPEKLEGNYWSNYSGTGNYTINGYFYNFDPYPLSSPPIYKNPTLYWYYSFLLLTLPLLFFFSSFVKVSIKRRQI
ncbi:MAG: NosD domain-containing protein [Candidatus Heimdallarchaeaceae archaeon]